MDGDVRGVGDELALPVEEGAGEVQTFLDVHRVGSVGQGHPHLFGDGHEQVVEDLQQDGIDVGAEGDPCRARLMTSQDQFAAGSHLGLPAGLDEGGGPVLADDGRSADYLPGPQGGTLEEGGGMIPAPQVQGQGGEGRVGAGWFLGTAGEVGTGRVRAGAGGIGSGGVRGVRGSGYGGHLAEVIGHGDGVGGICPNGRIRSRGGEGGKPGPPTALGLGDEILANDLHGNRLHHQRLVHHDETEALAMGGSKSAANGRQIRTCRGWRLPFGDGDAQGRVAAGVAQAQGNLGAQAVRGQPLRHHLGAPGGLQLRPCGDQSRDQLRGQCPLQGLLLEQPCLRQAHAIGGQHARQGVDEDSRHPQGIGHGAGMLAAGATEAAQGVGGDVVAALGGDVLDGVGHVLHGDAQEAFSQGRGGQALTDGRLDLRGQDGETLADDLPVQGLALVGTKDLGETVRLNPPQEQVAIGEGQGPAAPVAGRPGIGPGGGGTNPQPGAVETADGATPRRHGVDVQHGRPQPHASDLGVEGPLKVASIVGDIGGGATHVEGDDALEPGRGGGAGGAHQPPGGAGEDAVLALEVPGVGQSTVGLHEQEAGCGRCFVAGFWYRTAAPALVRFAGQLTGYLIDIAAQDGREVGVHHRGIAAPHQLGQGADLVRDGDLGEADLPGQGRRLGLVVGIAVAVKKDDGHGADAGREGRYQGGTGGGAIQGHQDLSRGRDSLGHRGDPLVEQLRQDDPPGEELGAILMADAQGIPEPPGDEQEGPVAAALQEGVGGDRGAHLHRRDGARRNGHIHPLAQQVTDTVQGGIVIALRIVRQQLMG